MYHEEDVYEEFNSELMINGLRFEQTCYACPEQYDVFDGNKEIGYVRLRWGHLRAHYPDYKGEIVYESDIGDGAWSGLFTSNKERMYHLTEIAKILNTKKNSVLINELI